MNLIAWPDPFYLHSERCTYVCGRRGQSKGHWTVCATRPVIHPPSSDRRRKTPVKGIGIGKVLRMFTVTPRKAAADCSSDGKGTVGEDARKWERKPEVVIHNRHTHISSTREFSLSEVDLSQLRSLKARVHPRIKKKSVIICFKPICIFFFHAKQIGGNLKNILKTWRILGWTITLMESSVMFYWSILHLIPYDKDCDEIHLRSLTFGCRCWCLYSIGQKLCLAYENGLLHPLFRLLKMC